MLVSLTHINTRAFVLDSMNGEGYGPVVTVLEMYTRTAVGLLPGASTRTYDGIQ